MMSQGYHPLYIKMIMVELVFTSTVFTELGHHNRLNTNVDYFLIESYSGALGLLDLVDPDPPWEAHSENHLLTAEVLQ